MRAALYCRSSKDRSDVSIEAQRRELEALKIRLAIAEDAVERLAPAANDAQLNWRSA
jgi:DNA invertase Pin-like site-specific DNA recombinase